MAAQEGSKLTLQSSNHLAVSKSSADNRFSLADTDGC